MLAFQVRVSVKNLGTSLFLFSWFCMLFCTSYVLVPTVGLDDGFSRGLKSWLLEKGDLRDLIGIF